MIVVDPAIVRSHFAQLDPAIADLLMTTLIEDIHRLGRTMLEAVSSDDETAMSAARHALRGLCGSFGAVELNRLLSTDLRVEGAEESFLNCIDDTILLIRTAAAA